MRENPALTTERRLLLAALLFSAAVFIDVVLLVRLPHVNVVLAFEWTLAAGAVVGGLSMAAFAVLAGVAPTLVTTSAQRFGVGLLASSVTAIAILATAHNADSGPFVFASGLAASTMLIALAWAAEFRLSSLSPHLRISLLGDSDEGELDANLISSGVKDCASRDIERVISIETAMSESLATPPLPEHVEQTSSRYVAEGRDCVETCLRVRFEPGQQTAVVHLPIQPAMSSVPEVECEPCDGTEMRITVDPVQPYGVRLVVRRPAPFVAADEAVIAVLISADRLPLKAAG